MHYFYVILLFIFLITISILLYKGKINKSIATCFYSISIIFVVIIQFDVPSFTSAKLGFIEIEKNLTESREIRDEIIKMKSSIEANLANNRKLAKINAEFSIINYNTKKNNPYLKGNLNNRLANALTDLTKLAEPDSTKHINWIKEMNKDFIEAGYSSLFE